jgi:hypothetical protein
MELPLIILVIGLAIALFVQRGDLRYAQKLTDRAMDRNEAYIAYLDALWPIVEQLQYAESKAKGGKWGIRRTPGAPHGYTIEGLRSELRELHQMFLQAGEVTPERAEEFHKRAFAVYQAMQDELGVDPTSGFT